MSNKIDLTQQADQCVMCGMCLPYCPTYQVSQHEAESPRGRISLIKALAENKLTASKVLHEHIQSCTGCLKCQQICPAKVNYQVIIDQGRNLYRSKQNFTSRWLQTLSIAAATHQWGHTATKLTSHITKWLPVANRHLRLLQYVSRENNYQPSAQQYQSEVNIFPGCTGDLFDQQTLNSLIKLLEAINVKAILPNTIICCGALSQHSGQLNKAELSINKLQEYFSTQSSSTLLSVASGCGRQLNEQLSNSSIKHFDAMHWLSLQDGIKELKFSSYNQRVLVHKPCTLSSANQQHMDGLLSQIPTIELIQFDDNLACCGAGGIQLTSPQQSNLRLLNKKIDTIRTVQPDLIVSANIGCALNFQLTLEKIGLDIEVVHPLTLLARQLTA